MASPAGRDPTRGKVGRSRVVVRDAKQEDSFMPHRHRVATRIAAMLLFAWLSGCGGGRGADGEPTASPAAGDPGSAASAPASTPSAPSSPASSPTAPTSPATPADPAIASLTFPIEVLGDGSPGQPAVAEASLAIDATKLASASRLTFTCHRCGFYAAPEFEATTAAPAKIKVSIRVLGGADATAAASVPWIDVTDANVTLADAEAVEGGVNGGFYTTHVALALDAATQARLVALPGYNRVQFRFNGTDGESNGFRVLALAIRDAANGDLGANPVVQADPLVDRAATGSAADVAAGQALWTGTGVLAKSAIVPRKLQASCSGCHAEGGQDLQYFNYSNNAIVQRSRFHGLSAQQGAQIVAFLRTSLQGERYASSARPWNPPFQPGPGLDCTGAGCEVGWDAGAGLGAVLATPADAVKALFGKSISAAVSVSQADVDAVMDPAATMNVRQMQTPMQFPDWNAWLPSLHPVDVWPTKAGADSFEAGAVFSGSGTGRLDPDGAYKALDAWFQAHRNPNGVFGDWSHLTADQRVQVQAMMTQSGWQAYSFLGGGRGNHVAPAGTIYGAQVGAANLQKFASGATTATQPAAFTTNAFIERAVGSMLHWNVVKQWELVHEYGLEGNQAWFIGDKDAATGAWKGRGEAHGWPFNTPGAFYLAPHMLYQADTDASGNVTRQLIQAWETGNVIASYYRTNQWYQLQMTINAGGQSGWSNYPMDWPYLTGFDELIGQTLGTGTAAKKAERDGHFVRLLQGRIKAAQYVDNAITLYDAAQPDLVANAGRYGRAQTVKHLATANYLDMATSNGSSTSAFHALDDVSAGLYLKVVNGSIHQFNALYAQTAASAWRRCDPANTQLGDPEPISGFRYCLDARRTPLGRASDGSLFINQTSFVSPTEQTEQYGIWKATQLGAEPQRLKAWSDWAASMWPSP